MSERNALFPENGEQVLVPIKGLRLITPQQAIELGVETEGHIFVSRAMSSKQLCDPCGVEFSALVYDVGRITRAQHMHESDSEGGGIYYFLGDDGNYLSASTYGWVARVEPRGVQITNIYGTIYGRAEEVVTAEIMALCCNYYCKDKLTDEGVAVFDPQRPGALISYHRDCVPDKEGLERVLEFKIVAGRPLFSQI